MSFAFSSTVNLFFSSLKSKKSMAQYMLQTISFFINTWVERERKRSETNITKQVTLRRRKNLQYSCHSHDSSLQSWTFSVTSFLSLVFFSNCNLRLELRPSFLILRNWTACKVRMSCRIKRRVILPSVSTKHSRRTCLSLGLQRSLSFSSFKNKLSDKARDKLLTFFSV